MSADAHVAYRMRTPRFAGAVGSLTRMLGWAIPEKYQPYSLPFGLLAIAAAQLTFNVGEPDQLPLAGVFAILAGICAVAWWAAAVGQQTIPRDRGNGVGVADAMRRADPAMALMPKVILSCLGALLLGVLLFRVLSGADNTWDVGLWLLSIGAIATLFVPDWFWSAVKTPALLQRSREWEFIKENWRGALPLLAILIVYGVVTIPNLTAWRYAALGDEYLFYEHARAALEGGTTQPFRQNGVYDNNPEFNTLYKAAWMGIFGGGHFGWKMTGVASMMLAVCGLYALGRILGGRGMAIAAAGLFAASHYLLGLLHGGYNHLDALPIMIWTLVAFVMGVRNRDPWPLFLAGVGVGIGFYFHYSARIVGPVMLLVVLASVHPRDYLRFWPVIAGFAVAVWPTLLLAQGEILTKMIEQTPAGYSPVVVGSAGERLLSNIKLNLPAVFFNTSSHTYVGGALLDPVSGALAAVGLGLAIGTRGRLASKLCLIWLAVAFLATGLTSPYPTTAITRLFPMVPALALLGGLAIATGYNQTAGKLRRLPTTAMRAAAPITLTLLLVAALGLNQYRALVGTHEDFHYTRESLAVGASRTHQCEGEPGNTVFAGVHPESTLSKVIASYSPGRVQPTAVPFSEFDIEEQLQAPACVIIHDADSREGRWVMAQLRERYPSGIFYTYTTPSNKSRVEFFHIPNT